MSGRGYEFYRRVLNSIYSCFERGCPTKPYATMPNGIMGNRGSWSLIETQAGAEGGRGVTGSPSHDTARQNSRKF